MSSKAQNSSFQGSLKLACCFVGQFFNGSLLNLFLYLGCNAYSIVSNLYIKHGGIFTGINACVPSGVAHWQP